MKTLSTLICFILLNISYCNSKDQNEVKKEINIKSSKTFICSYINKTITEDDIKLNLEYVKDGSKEELKLSILKNDNNSDSESQIRTSTTNDLEEKIDQIDMNLIADAINNLINKYSGEPERSINKVTLLDIYTWIYHTIYSDGNIPKAGTFYLTNRIKYYNDNTAEKDLTNSIEVLVDQENKIVKRINALNVEKEALNNEKITNDTAITHQHLYNIFKYKGKNTITNNIVKQLAIINQFIHDEKYDTAGLSQIEHDLDSISKLLIKNEKIAFAKFDLNDSLKKIKAHKNIIEINFGPVYNFLIKNYKNDIIQIHNAINDQNYMNELETLKKKISNILNDSIKSLIGSNDISEIDKIVNSTETSLQIANKKISAINSLSNSNNLFKKKDIKNLELQLSALQKKITLENIINIRKIDLQLERGFIENVKVIADIDGIQHIFENSFAIGFTSKRNFSDLSKIKLYNRNRSFKSQYIYLGDVVSIYDNNIDLYTRDYSPADTNISINPNKFMTFDVYKANFSNLFDVKFFTDLTGISENQPNGLVQFEVSRKLNINTFRFQQSEDINIGGFNYLYLFGSFNKIESNNRELKLRNDNIKINNQIASPNYATALDLIQFRNICYGFELNSLLFDWPNAKTTFTIDLGAQYGQTPLSNNILISPDLADSFTTKLIPKYANMLMLYPKFKAEIFSERRLGLTVSYSLNHTQFFTNNKFKPIVSYSKSNTEITYLEPNSRWSHTFEANIRAELNEDGTNKIFLRTRIFWQQGDVNTYFPQIQLGYSTFLKIPKM